MSLNGMRLLSIQVGGDPRRRHLTNIPNRCRMFLTCMQPFPSSSLSQCHHVAGVHVTFLLITIMAVLLFEEYPPLFMFHAIVCSRHLICPS